MVHKKSSFENYTISNFGTLHSFNPTKKVIDHSTNKERTLLSIHLDYVREARHKLVYIIDNFGMKLIP